MKVFLPGATGVVVSAIQARCVKEKIEVCSLVRSSPITLLNHVRCIIGN